MGCIQPGFAQDGLPIRTDPKLNVSCVARVLTLPINSGSRRSCASKRSRCTVGHTVVRRRFVGVCGLGGAECDEPPSSQLKGSFSVAGQERERAWNIAAVEASLRQPSSAK